MTSTSEFDARLARLERESHRLKIRFFALAGFLIVAAGVVGWQLARPRDLLRLQRLELVDSNGVVVAELGKGAHGTGLVLRGDRDLTLYLMAGTEGGGLIVEDAAGPDVSLLGGNQPYLFFGDSSDPQSLLVGLDPADGQPRLQLKYRDRIFLAGAGEDGIEPRLWAKDRQGRVVWAVP